MEDPHKETQEGMLISSAILSLIFFFSFAFFLENSKYTLWFASFFQSTIKVINVYTVYLQILNQALTCILHEISRGSSSKNQRLFQGLPYAFYILYEDGWYGDTIYPNIRRSSVSIRNIHWHTRQYFPDRNPVTQALRGDICVPLMGLNCSLFS